MLYIIGLGLNLKGISVEGFEIVKRCKKIYLEGYTVNFPYAGNVLREFIGKKIELADREKVEGLEIVDEAKKKDVALLVYGAPLIATTHIALLDEAKKSRVKCKVIHAGSVLDAIAETGLQLYKFGKIASMPVWKKNFEPTSFTDVIKDNQKIRAHSLILVDIGLPFEKAIEQLEKALQDSGIKLGQFLVCSMLGTKNKKIYLRTLKEFKEYKIRKPFCFIIPGKMHFVEEGFLRGFRD
ncbi:diphthine synthase [Candidatus Pacearchaeota archaeon]|jgi:diphthine synthase|nr:diphthine synthase [Candidatus Pacearchaeota archaeon]